MQNLCIDIAFYDFTEPEVSYFGFSRMKHDIFKLDISVNDLFFVENLVPVADFLEKDDCFFD